MATRESSGEAGRSEEPTEEFGSRLRRGERPSPRNSADRPTELAGEILERAMASAGVEPEPEVADTDPHGGRPIDPPVPPSLPRQTGDYRILREVGRGGMGVVYEAEQISLGRKVALKVLPARSVIDRHATERFRREARAAARLHHTNIVPVFEVGRDGETFYYAMQFIQGQGLDLVIRELARLRPGVKRPPAAGDRTDRGFQADPQARTATAADAGAAGPDATETLAATRAARSLLLARWDPPPTLNEAPTSRAEKAAATETAAPEPTLDFSLDPHPAEPSLTLPGGPGPEPATGGSGLVSSVGSASLSSSKRAPYYQSVARIGLQIAQGLAYAHARGIVHRDIKPSNLLLDAAGVVWITDFGLAKADDDGLTRTGDILGTIRYMAPERFRGLGDARADLYALGATLYELIALAPAFEHSDRLRLIDRIKDEEPARLATIDPRVPRDLETIIRKAMQKDPSRRYASAENLAADLGRFLADEPILARRTSFMERAWRSCRRNPLVAGLSAAAVILLAVTACVASLAYVRTSDALRNRNRSLRAERIARIDEASARARERNAQEETVRERDRARGALYHSLVGEARALRAARAPGYRGKVWERLRQAAKIETPDRDLGELRRQAVLCMGDFTGLEPSVIEQKDARTVALSPNGETIAIGVGRGDLSIRRINGGPAPAFIRSASPIRSLAFSSDGRSLRVGRANGSIERFRESPDQRWEKLGELRGAPNLFDLAANAAGESISLSKRKDALVVAKPDAADSAVSMRYRLPGRDESAPVLSPTGRYAAVSGKPAEARESGDGLVVFDAEKGAAIGGVDSRIGPVLALAFSPDEKLLAVGCNEGLMLLEVPSLVRRSVIRWEAVVALGFSPDGQYLVVATIGKLIKIWNTETGREIATLSHPNSFHQVAITFSGDGRRMAVAGNEKTLVWSFGQTPERFELAGHSAGTTAAQFSPDGKLLASTSKDKRVRIWDVSTGTLLNELTDFRASVQDATFSPDGSILVTADYENQIRFWDAKSLREIKTPRGLESNSLGGVNRVAYDKSGRLFAAVGFQGVRIWRVDPETNDSGPTLPRFTPIANIPVPDALDIRFSSDGKFAAFSYQYRSFAIWDLSKNRAVPFTGAELMNGWRSLALRPNGKQISYVDMRGKAVFYEMSTGLSLFAIGSEGSFIGSHLTISPKGTWLAGLATTAGVAIGRLSSRDLAYTLRDERGPVWSIDFSPDETRLAVGLADGGIAIWDLTRIADEIASLGLADPPVAMPKNAAERLRRGVELLEANHVGAAIEPLTEAVRLDPDSPQARYRLGFALQSEGENDRAFEHLKRACELDARNADARHRLGLALISSGKTKEALEQFRAAVTISPNHAGAWSNAGVCLVTLGQSEEAIEPFRKAIELDPGNPAPAIALSGIFLRQGKTAEALEVLKRAESRNPREPERLEPYIQLVELLVRLPRVVAGEDKPASFQEAAVFAKGCYDRKQYAAATRIAEAAFLADPVQTDQIANHQRYNAACSAALAAAGKAIDAPNLDAAGKARLRKLAIDWLNQDLDAYARELESDPSTAAQLIPLLSHWSSDADLAGLREPAELAKLPETESAACRAVWEKNQKLITKYSN